MQPTCSGSTETAAVIFLSQRGDVGMERFSVVVDTEVALPRTENGLLNNPRNLFGRPNNDVEFATVTCEGNV
jgi:hypothetical protein